MSFYLNDLLLQTIPTQTSTTLSLPPVLENGFYTLRVTIHDTNGGEGNVEVPVNVVLPLRTTPAITWQSPAFGTIFNRVGLTINFQATSPPLAAGSSAEFIMRSLSTNTSQQVARQTDLKGSNISFMWRGPADVGTYAMTIKIIQPGQPDLLSDELYFGIK